MDSKNLGPWAPGYVELRRIVDRDDSTVVPLERAGIALALAAVRREQDLPAGVPRPALVAPDPAGARRNRLWNMADAAPKPGTAPDYQQDP